MCNGCGEEVDMDSRFRQRTLRDRLIFGLQDQTMQKEVLKEKLGDLTLNRTREICRSHEGSTKTQDKMQNKEIRRVTKKEEPHGGQASGKKKSSYKQGKTGGGSSTGGGAGQGGGPGKEPQGGGKTITDCGNCGRTHLEGACPAKGLECWQCTRIGHFASVCRSEPAKQNNAVFLVNSVEKEEPLLELETVINGKERTVTWLVDTGSQVPVLRPEDVQLFGMVKVKPSKSRLIMADSSKSDVMGQVDAIVHLGETAHEMQVLVVKDLERSTLDFRALVALGLIEEGWPKVRRHSQEKDPVSQLTDEELEGDEELETIKEFSVRTVQVVDRAEEQMDKKALRGYKNLSWKDRRARIPSWKDWCSVRMQERARPKSEADMYYPSKEDDNPKRAGSDTGQRSSGRGPWLRRRSRRRPDRSKSGAFPQGQGFPVGAWRMERSG